MKRDLDTIRLLMETFEACPSGQTIQTISGTFPVTPTDLFAHIELLINAGYIEGTCRVSLAYPTGGSMKIKAITWAGHDFLDAARNEDVWESTKKRLKQTGSWTFSLMLEILKDEAKKRLGSFLPTS